MASTNAIGNEGTVEEASNERLIEAEVGVEGTPELRPSVEQEIQARVDTNHPAATPGGLTLIEEERLEAGEWEIERTQMRYDRRATSDREARTRRAARRGSLERRRRFGRRAASVDPWADPKRADPRESLSRDVLARVNREAARLADELTGWSRAAIGRRLAERVVDGMSMTGAVVGTFEELERAPGTVIPIEAIGEVPRQEVSIRGEVTVLWEPSHPKIAQVGLLEDESGRTRFTVWKASNLPCVRVGEQVVFRNVSTSWYGGRVSVALTGWSQVTVLDHQGWWMR